MQGPKISPHNLYHTCNICPTRKINRQYVAEHSWIWTGLLEYMFILPLVATIMYVTLIFLMKSLFICNTVVSCVATQLLFVLYLLRSIKT